jgi:murein DD-endopeptidase MepM/ murein hydrolase activator NlpD
VYYIHSIGKIEMMRIRHFSDDSGLSRVVTMAIGLAVLLVITTPAGAITKAEVDSACADSRAAQVEFEAAQARKDTVASELDEVYHVVVDLTADEVTLRGNVIEDERTIAETRDGVLNRALDVYMNQGSGFESLFLLSGSIDKAITGAALVQTVAEEDVADIDRLESLAADNERRRAELDGIIEIRRNQEVGLEARNIALENAFLSFEAARNELSASCRAAQAEYQKQLAIARAKAAAAKSGAAGGLPDAATPGFICPNSGSNWFSNDWGNPRSGGRRHKGTDIFGKRGSPLVAVAKGTVRTGNGGLGGITVWVNSDYGVNYYYAHMGSIAPGITTGSRVNIGDKVGTVGDSGNARGGTPHNHFGIWVNGWVNPYRTLARNC